MEFLLEDDKIMLVFKECLKKCINKININYLLKFNYINQIHKINKFYNYQL
jgi:hypothetical protein